MVKLPLMIIMIYPVLVFAQPTNPKPQLKASKATSPIKIDGILDEAAWKIPDSAGYFIEVEPHEGSAAKFPTMVRIVYDDQNLYIGAVCYDSIGRKGIRVTELRRDFEISKNDVFGICIDAFNDKRNNVTFAANPYGAQHDYLSFDAQLTDIYWNGLWKVRTSIQSYGWIAEFEIPWKTLRYKGNTDHKQWGINFYRQKRSSNEVSVWSPYPRSFSFNRMEFAGELNSFDTPSPSANFQVNAYTLGSQTNSTLTTSSNNQYKAKAGGDFKWAINSNAVLDLTVNTDFAQADADIAVNNISRFSVLYPERRQFYLENASLFSPGLNGTGGSMFIYPFFSRTIGLDNGVPVPISGGARFVNRSPEKNFGCMYIQQAETDNTPATHYAVARYSQNISKQNRIGGLLSMKSNSSKALYSSNTNINASVDGFFRINEKNSISVMGIHSSNSYQNKQGFAGYYQYLYTSNAIQGFFTQALITKNYQNETGFVSRQDVISTSPAFVTNLRGKWLPFKKWIRAIQPDAAAEFYHQASTGKLIESSIAIYPFWVLLHSGGFFGYSITPVYQYLTEPFAPLGALINPGTYHYSRSTFYVSNDPSAKISYSLIYDIGKYFNGRLASTTATLAITPVPYASLRASLSNNNFKELGAGRQSGNVSLYTLEGRFAMNPRLQLNSLLQYNTQNKNAGFYVRFSWEYRPLSYLFFVFNNRLTNTAERFREQQAIVKLSYLKQF
ncbi:hypothetical protein GS399_11310 [Pedobacter sp. HMF7647]|uniref:Hydrolase n=1 Tax=Hufsiella arboris TaxID=2695275 RepID=A0A7K1YBU9_9SPHI|nr:carbohydrate binding family 9 domain-containing protein [Hufsiella arboris]MXV51559.1 hypothetical protein [Hufsiella arboris]